jgi:prepilin-type N-terminal cleavage/methylation domain-containing protein
MKSRLYKFKSSKNNRGFTLIEVMVAITLFAIVMIIGTGAVLNTNRTYRKTETARAAIDNMNFVIEDMARNLRLGETYRCLTSADNYWNGTLPQSMTSADAQDCPNGSTFGLAFTAVDGNIVVYRFYTISGKTEIQKLKQNDSPLVWKSLTPQSVEISPSPNTTSSSFVVIGSSDADTLQPRVTIRLSGKVKYKDIETPFGLQTTVSQRIIDR